LNIDPLGGTTAEGASRMIGYVTIGATDFDRSLAFYDALLGSIGAKRLMELEGFVLLGKSVDEPCLAVVKPFDGKPQSVGNGIMIALRFDSKEAVDTLYAKALELGGTDEGPPGDRDGIFHAAYFRDLDGNKLNAFYIGE
jgi:catechol 2,3-dioxygenase-like lactoylglutathione lyase family enzyme